MNDIEQVCSQCRDRAEIKFQFSKPDTDHLKTAIQALGNASMLISKVQ